MTLVGNEDRLGGFVSAHGIYSLPFNPCDDN